MSAGRKREGIVEQTDERMIVSATDLVNHLECGHLSVLDLYAASQPGLRKPRLDDPAADVLRKRGDEHERRHLASLMATFEVIEIPAPGGQDRVSSLRAGEANTFAAMQAGADVIFQATFLDEREDVLWRGHADFLRKSATPSRLGSHSYEPEDAKLARRVKASAVLQLCQYAEQVERLQGSKPELIHVALGDGRQESVRLDEVSVYYRSARRRFLADLDSPPTTYPDPVAHCALCHWAEECADRREADDHLTRVARLTGEQGRKLASAGIPTLAALAAVNLRTTAITGIRPATLVRLRRQAQLQRNWVPDEAPLFEVDSSCEPGSGLDRLPAPDPGDLFYDIEGDPHVGDHGLEYLHGLASINGAKGFDFQPFWAHDSTQEKQAFEGLIDAIVEQRRQHRGMHVYHYAPYEISALKKLMGRYGTREGELDDLLRGEVFVDLYRVVRQGLVIGSPSYSLKKLEPLYMPGRTGAITDAGSSIVQYEEWLASGDDKILADIEAYNRDDVESTHLLRDWLESVRPATAIRPVGPPTSIADTSEKFDDQEADNRTALVEELLSGIEGVPGVDAPETDRARFVLGHLVRWHRREAKPEWWQFFHRVRGCDEQDLYEDTEAIAGLELVGDPEPNKQSLIWRYRFDPDQEHKLKVGEGLRDPVAERAALEAATGKSAPSPGILVRIDGAAGELELKRGKRSTVPHPTSLIPGIPVNTTEQQNSLARLGRTFLEGGLDGGQPGEAALQLLAGRPPRIDGVDDGEALRRDGESTVDAAIRLVSGLQRSCLPIQGPPGAGKTYTAAHVIVALVRDGKRVGIAANSHAVISNLLQSVAELAEQQQVSLRAMQKTSAGKDTTNHAAVTAASNVDIEQALTNRKVDVVAGTAWLFSRVGMIGLLDVLVIDEAGQLSLANVAAVAPSALSLVLVGDPRQLSQPSKGSHPDGAEASALEHALAGAATVSPDRGLFLDRTFRMHPDITAFISEQVYDGRLESEDRCRLQAIGGSGGLAGSGLRWAPVTHTGNRTSSLEEAAKVAELHRSLLGRTWTNGRGEERILGIDDVLVVAPYNAQVRALAEVLPEGARIGTVDRFQGREAAVVIASLAASTAEDVPRGMEFLYSRNRLNVAVSHAQAIAILVCSPDLLAHRCQTVAQMRLVNVLCRYVELADEL